MTDLIYEEQREPFVIDDAEKATWAVRKIAQLRATGKERETFYREQLALIMQQTQEAEAHLTQLLAAWFSSVPQRETPTTRKVALPDGELVLTQPTPEFTRNDAALCAWLCANGQQSFVDTQIVQKAKWAALKPRVLVRGEQVALADTGEIVPGVKVVMKPGTFTVKTK